MDDLRTIEVEANGINFTALEQGEGPLLLCLHGFPDNAKSFRYQFTPLAEAGYRVVAPYMRGYAPTSASPTGCYQSAALAHDVLALVDALGADKATLFGHDWGAVAAYGAAALDGSRFERLVTAAVPYGPGLASAFITNYEQLKRSWYIFFFQTPMAEMAVAHDDFAFIRNLWRDWSPGHTWPDELVGEVIATLSQPGVIEAALGYYRAMLDQALHDPALEEDQAQFAAAPVPVPTLYLQGDNDGCIGLELADGMEAMFPNGLTRQMVEGAGHFLHLERPEEVNRAVLEFLGK